MPAVTSGGIPYPLGTDQFKTYPATAAQAAQKIEQRLLEAQQAQTLLFRRTASDAFASGSMLPVGVEVSGSVPAGVYLLSWLAVSSSTAAGVSQYLRLLANGVNVTADVRSQFAAANLIQQASGCLTFTHGGGTLTVDLRLQHSSGTGTIHPGSFVSAVRVGVAP